MKYDGKFKGGGIMTIWMFQGKRNTEEIVFNTAVTSTR